MFDATSLARYEPASNLKGEPVGASWRFLLPSLSLDLAAVLGAVSPATLGALSQSARRIVEGPEAERLAAGSADLVVLGRGAVASQRPERLLKPGGIVFGERRVFGPRAADPERFWLSPPAGEVDAAAPLADANAIRFLAELARNDSGVRRTLPQRARRLLWRNALGARVRPRVGRLAGRPPGPPAYLCRIASASGLDLAHWGYALWAPGRYRSKKVLVFLFGPADSRPSIVVKLTRDSLFNDRLENEACALDTLEERALGRGIVPRLLFAGGHAGLAVVGESFVDGVPLRQRTSGKPDCPWFRSAVAFLLGLAAPAVEREGARPDEVADALWILYERYVDIYDPPERQRLFLAAQIDEIRRSERSFPLVFQHGDPGAWNAVALPDGRVTFLDWEAGEPDGMPLWDLVYFVRSYAASTGRNGRGRAAFLDDPALARALREAIAQQATAIGLEPQLVAPLFYTCFLHRAVKEAARLPSDRVSRGHYARLLGACVDRRDDEPLSSLLAPPVTAKP